MENKRYVILYIYFTVSFREEAIPSPEGKNMESDVTQDVEEINLTSVSSQTKNKLIK